MPVPELERFRQKYPQYNDLDDQALADRLAKKYPAYADLPGKVQAEAPTEQVVSQPSFIQNLFAPSVAVREGLGAIVGQDLQTAQDVLGATGVGQLAQAATAPPIRALAAMLPRQIGQAVGTAASLPIDPSTYAFGAAGAIPNRLARLLATGTVGGLAAAGQPQADAGSVAGGVALGAGTGALLRVRPRQRRVTFEKPSANIPDFLRGNPKRIEQASQTLDREAHKTVQSLRQGGKLHGKVFETISRESQKAWAPMQQVAGAIPDTIPLEEVKQAVAIRLAERPERIPAVNAFLDTMEQKAFRASELVDLSTEVGRFMKRSAIRGVAARNFADQIYSDVRSAVADVLEARAPQQMKGFVAQAKAQWADYATDRDALFGFFKPGASSRLDTDRGAKLLRQAALGQASPSDVEFLGRLKEASGVDLPASIKPFAEALVKARRGGERGRFTRKALTYGTLGFWGLDILRRIRGQ